MIMTALLRFIFVLLLFWLPEVPVVVAQEKTTTAEVGVNVNGDQFLEEEMTRNASPPAAAEKEMMLIQEEINLLSQRAYAADPRSPNSIQMWNRVLELNPRNSDAALQLGLVGLSAPSAKEQNRGIQLLEKVFDAARMDNPVHMPSPPGIALAMLIGRYQWEKQEYDAAYKFIRLADSASQSLVGIDSTCTAVSLATMLHPFPNSTQQADDMMDRYVKAAEAFLQNHKNPKLDEKQLSQTVAGAADDPYVHCALTIFYLSFYYRADVAKAANLHYQVVTRVWPQLAYQSPKFPKNALKTTKTCTAAPNKIKLGIASGFLTPYSSVAADFMGVLQRLDRNVFDITYIHFIARKEDNRTDNFVYQHEEDNVLILSKSPADQENGAWVTRYHKRVEALDLDILLYLDLTMSPLVTRVAMARLARVQATTHGHPVTSGIPSVDYYISWGAAELETTAQSHYSEKLVLLDTTVPHQYYEKRHDKNGRSVLDGDSYKAIERRSTFDSIPTDGNWYTCMQKPHKFMPEMDDLICGVLHNDQQARVILHEADISTIQKSFEKRLQRAGCDMQRVHFLPTQLHHRLLALYAVSTVILDSYPAGGCTTTREALELGKVVVTLPGRLLGGRWSYAYYQIMGDDTLISSVVAFTPEEYIKKAVALGKDKALREKTEFAITSNLHRLYGQQSAVASWESVLLQISPVERKKTCN